MVERLIHLTNLPAETYIQIETHPSTYHLNGIDSQFVLTYKDSKIIYGKTPSASFIQSALVKNNEIVLKGGIRVGMSFQEVMHILNKNIPYKTSKQVICLTWGEATTYLYLAFNRKKLNTITYCPYLG